MIYEKWNRIKSILKEKNKEGVLLSSQTFFSWLTGGRGFIGMATESACVKLLVTSQSIYVIANNIESERIEKEEIFIDSHVFKFITYDWFDPNGEATALASTNISTYLLESELTHDLMLARYPLMEIEREWYRELGYQAGIIIEQVARQISRGLSEFEVASLLTKLCLEKEIEPILTLVAADERSYTYRHPLPTNKKIDQHVLLALGARKHGLVASVSRIVHFGKLNEELTRKQHAITHIDATYIKNTRPQRNIGSILESAVEKYEAFAYGEEWKLHHQGGMTGYQSREYKAMFNSDHVVGYYQAFAWNPSIAGVKSEDTILVCDNENEILTRTGDFPEVEIKLNGTSILRPWILERRFI